MTDGRACCIVLNPQDNVAVAVGTLPDDASIGIGNIRTRGPIPAGHKVALAPLYSGAAVIKYGQVIGQASGAIQPGEHVHVDNLKMGTVIAHADPGQDAGPRQSQAVGDQSFFDGFVRSESRVGTRNYIGVLATVSCSSSVARFIADAVGDHVLADYPRVDGVVALGHGGGCCMAPGSEGLELLQRTIAGYARNPNFGGILLVGLGCEVNRVNDLMTATDLASGATLKTLVIQEAGGTRRTVDRGVAAIREMLPQINAARRTRVAARHLVVGLECGGSDAYSGITANPALGAAVDRLVQQGATAILSETPEIYGAEHLLLRRAASAEVGQQLMARIRWWETYTKRHGAQLNNNPTPGNKAGGITTILEKSMGAVAKAGTTRLNAVYGYAQNVRTQGLVFMDTPGYDVVSITGMIAGGANLVCFTTGRGTVCGFRPVPTLKLASNSTVYAHLSEDMDINCGRILDGEFSVAEMGAEIFKAILDTASGRPTRSEALGFGSDEFVPWHIGAVL